MLGSSDPAVVIVDVASWTIKPLNIVHTQAVLCCSFSPDGRRILLGSADCTASIIEVQEFGGVGALAESRLAWPTVHVIKGVHSAWVLDGCFSHDGCHVVLGSYDDTATLIDLREWGELVSEAKQDQLERLELLKLSKTTTKREMEKVQKEHKKRKKGRGGGGGDEAAACGVLTAAVRARVVKVIEHPPLQPGDQPAALHSNWIRTVCYSPDGKRVVVGSDDRSWSVIDIAQWQKASLAMAVASAATRKKVGSRQDDQASSNKDADREEGGMWSGIETFPNKLKSWVTVANFSPDGNQIILGCEDGSAVVVDAATKWREAKPTELNVPADEFKTEMSFTTVVMAGTAGGLSVTIKAANAAIIKGMAVSWAHPKAGKAVGKAVAKGTAKVDTPVVAAISGTKLTLSCLGNNVSSIVDGTVLTFSLDWQAALDNGRVFNSQQAGKQLGLDAEQMDAEWARYTQAAKIFKFGGVSQDGGGGGGGGYQGFYCGLMENVAAEPGAGDGAVAGPAKQPIYVLREASQTERYAYPIVAVIEAAHRGGLRAASFSADCKRVLLCSEDHTATVIDTNSWKVTSTIRQHRGWVRAGCFSPAAALPAKGGGQQGADVQPEVPWGAQGHAQGHWRSYSEEASRNAGPEVRARATSLTSSWACCLPLSLHATYLQRTHWDRGCFQHAFDEAQ